MQAITVLQAQMYWVSMLFMSKRLRMQIIRYMNLSFTTSIIRNQSRRPSSNSRSRRTCRVGQGQYPGSDICYGCEAFKRHQVCCKTSHMGRCYDGLARFRCFEETKYVPMLVPLKVAVLVSDLMPTDNTLTPGAKTSTPVPKFENDALTSFASTAPTVIADGAEAGESFNASCC
jgi:hypothetical protein